MDRFIIGDKVIYPTQGIGIIEDVQDENLYGEDFHIYHLRIRANNTLIMVPSSNTEEIGIRKLISEEKIKNVYAFMRNGSVKVSKNWKGRYREHAELMKTGSLLDIALVLKSLYCLDLTKPLSFREKKMMEKAKDMVVSELSEVSENSIDDIEKLVLENLSACFKGIKLRLGA